MTYFSVCSGIEAVSVAWGSCYVLRLSAFQKLNLSLADGCIQI